ncbi:SGNH/GDSL hydrolase family protein [Amphibiibacter pelophylacis]|uniref:SGNH/GDSL hydrolase family protein n=1 Tax=Amphibiibacter pelophylacis TaxID=1799477 RepID=A0ACC6P1Z7_9BURK
MTAQNSPVIARSLMCFGDSNTWGADPSAPVRFPRHVRWPGVLATLLAPQVHVIEEGLSGRTTCLEDPFTPWRRGSDALPMLLATHLPLDGIVIMLGTNDCKQRFGLPTIDIALGVAQLLKLVHQAECGPNGATPRVLVVAPPPIVVAEPTRESFAGAPERSQGLAAAYATVAREAGADFLDAGQIIRSSAVDGIHFDADQHPKLAQAVADVVRGWWGLAGAQ